MTDADAIRNLISRYFQHLDDRDFEAWQSVLAPGASITINGEERWPPKVQILDQRGQHISVNQIIDVDGNQATAVFDYFYIAEIGPTNFQRLVVLSMGRYTDTFVKQDDRWQIQSVAMNVLYADRLRDNA